MAEQLGHDYWYFVAGQRRGHLDDVLVPLEKRGKPWNACSSIAYPGHLTRPSHTNHARPHALDKPRSFTNADLCCTGRGRSGSG